MLLYDGESEFQDYTRASLTDLGDLILKHSSNRPLVILVDGRSAGVEFVGTSISSKGDGTEELVRAREFCAENPSAKFFNDERGYVRIVGRSKDLIISGGYNVYPAEIEGYINEMPGVAESAVVGVPHPDFGEVGVAVVVARPGASVEGEAVIASLKSRLANFKIPKRCHVVADLPRNTMGKVQKNLLRDQYKGTFA